MARNRRYDLYEGDGEEIGGTGRERWSGERALPGKAPLGREEELRERDEAARRAENAVRSRRRYFPENESEEETPVSLFDDFDRFQDPLPELEFPKRKRKKRIRHKGAWAFAMVLSVIGILVCGWLLIPQITGSTFRLLPNIAFANGTLMLRNEETVRNFEACVEEIYTDRIYRGVYADGLHVGGMTKAEAMAALTEQADMEGTDFDIVITVGNQSWHVTPERVPVSRNVAEIVEQAYAQGRGNTAGLRGTGRTPFQERLDRASDLRSFPVSLQTEKTWDHDALRELCQGIANYVNRDPVNSTVATFDFGTKTFTFTEDQPGARLDAEELYDRVGAMLDEGNYFNSLFMTPEKIIADVTRTELMNSFGLISAYTTKTTSNKNRNKNIQLSAQAINGVTVLPGEIFSFNGTTGERTAEKGYLPAAAISGGQSRDEIGGGVCQTSSTLFNAAARANLEILERSPHAWPSSYVEKGFDATVNWPGLDFKFRNNTDWPIFIIAAYADRKVSVSIYGMSLGADVRIDLESVTTKTIPQPEGTNYVINPELKVGESKKTVTGRKGYVVETWKVWYQGERETGRELLFTSTYKAYQETIEYNPYPN